MDSLENIIEREYLVKYRKRCNTQYIAFTILSIIVEILVGLGVAYFTGGGILYTLLLVLIVYKSNKKIKIVAFEKYDILLNQLEHEYSKVEGVEHADVYSIISEVDTIQIMFRCNKQDYCLAIDDCVVIIEELSKQDSAIF